MTCPFHQSCDQSCRHLGVCTKRWFLQVRAEDVKKTEHVRAVRETVSKLTRGKNVKPARCRNWLYDLLWELRVQPVNQNREPVEPDMDDFEPTDEIIDNDLVPLFDERQREFFRVNACSEPNPGLVFVTARWHTQFATMATIVGAYCPDESQWWPRVINGQYVDPRVANDNRSPEPR